MRIRDLTPEARDVMRCVLRAVAKCHERLDPSIRADDLASGFEALIDDGAAVLVQYDDGFAVEPVERILH